MGLTCGGPRKLGAQAWGSLGPGVAYREPGAADAFVNILRAGVTDTGTPGALVSVLGSLGLRSQAREPQGLDLRYRDPRAWVLAARNLGPESQTTNCRVWVSDVRVLGTVYHRA